MPSRPDNAPATTTSVSALLAFDAPRAFAALKSAMPDAQPSLESGDQVFLRDPDGVRVQLADVKYKR